MATTDKMAMDLPDVETTLGPEWATKLNTALSDRVDSHNHTNGQGNPVPVGGLSIGEALPLNGFPLTAAQYVGLDDNALAPSGARFVYSSSGDLWWLNGDGTEVQITDGATLAAASLGAIGGLASPASADYSSDTGTFTWTQDTDQAAAMDCGPITIRDTAASAKGITIQSPVGLADDYDITLPAAAPASTKFLRMGSTGAITADGEADETTLEVSGSTLQIKDLGVSTAKIAAGAVTRAKQEAVGQQLSAAVSSVSRSTVAYGNATGLTATLTTTGRPVMAMLQSDAGGTPGTIRLLSYPALLRIAVTGDATAYFGEVKVGKSQNVDGDFYEYIPLSALFAMLPISAGTYTFQVQFATAQENGAVTILNAKLAVWEL